MAPDEMEKVFAGFLKASGLDHEKVTPLGALELICAFYTDVSFRGRPRGMGDMLLYQHGTRGEETTIGFVRQLYARGRGKQLCFNLVYPAPKLRVPESVSLWTTNVASLNEWIAAVKKHVAAAESVSMHPHVKMSLESF